MLDFKNIDTSGKMKLFLQISICLLPLVARTIATGTYEQRHIMKMPDAENFLKSVFTEYLGTCTVLTLPNACSYKALDVCHLNEVDENLYYEYCFKAVCEKDKYFCLNGEHDTVHICGSMPRCRKRYRNIVVNRPGQKIVDVYSVLCPDGYLQLSVTNCFTPCSEDRSVVVIRGSSPNQNALGYCNSETSYCNSRSVNVFELSSDDDACKAVKTKCPETEDLLSNCSCAVKCLPHQTRSWRNNFNCQQSVSVSASPSTVKQTPSLTTSPRPSPRHSTINRERNTENSEHSTDTDNSSGVITAVGIVIIVLLAGVIVVLVRICRSQREYQEVSKEQEQDSRDDEVSSGSRTVNVEKKKTVVHGNVFNIKSPSSIHITTQSVPDAESKHSNQTVVLDISDQDSENLNVNDHELENLNTNDHELEYLKENFNNQENSGILLSEQTYLKEP